LQDDVMQQLQREIRRLSQAGIEVGLCSDSPLEPLKRYVATPLGMKGPIIAENGHVIGFGDKKLRLRALPDVESLRREIEEIISRAPMPHSRKEDCLSAEFQEQQIRFDQNEWAFGAGREASVSIFAPGHLISYIVDKLVLPPELSMDVSPDYNYLAIHPGRYRANKAETLAALAAYGYGVHMVGNSMSDWVDPKSGVRCGFVGGSSVAPEILQRAALTSTKTTVEGVIEILKQVR
jgi:hypothetical protein